MEKLRIAATAIGDEIRSGAIPLPANMRLVRRDMMPPRESSQTAQGGQNK